MTKTRDLILSFIRDYISAHGYAPTLREIGAGVGLSSTSTVSQHLDRMDRDRLIERSRGARAIKLPAEQPKVTVLKHKNNVATVIIYDNREYILRPPGMFQGMKK